MIRFTHLVRIAALAAGVALGAPATAATITLDMPLCNSFSVQGTTLTCETGTVPTCQIAGPTSGTLGSAVSLTATCTNGPITGWAWTGCTVPSGNTCTLNPGAAGTFPVTVAGTSATGTGAASAPYNVVFSATPPSAPTNCTLSATPNPVATAGGTTNLSVTCGGGAPTTYVWSGAGVVAVNAAATTAVVNTTSTYQVTVSNGGGSTTASRSVTVGTGGGGGSCAGLTTQDFNGFDFDGSNLHIDLGKGDKEVAIFSYTAQAADIGKVADLNVVEHGSGIHYYTVWASKTRCDMTSTSRLTSTTSPTIFVSVNGAQQVNMQPGETWYFMIRNWSATGRNSCSDTTCGTLVSKHLWR